MESQKNKFAISILIILFLAQPFIIKENFAKADTPLSVQYSTGFANIEGGIVNFPLLEAKGSLALDLSGFKNHGVLSFANGSQWLPGGGLYFSGTNSSLAVNASSSLQSPYKTVAVKFMWDGHNPHTELYLYDDGWSGNGSLIMYVHPVTSRLYAEFITNNGTHKTIWQPINVSTVYTAIFSFDGLNYALWVNSQVQSGSLQASGTLQTNSSITIGSDHSRIRQFSGNLYAVEIFNRSLTFSELSTVSESLQEPSLVRFDSSSKYVIGGWVNYSNDSLSGSIMPPVRVYLNQTSVTSSDESGVFRFVLDLPQEVGNYTYVVTADNDAKAVSTFVVVDRVVVADSGSTPVMVGKEAVAWFKLVSAFDGESMVSGNVFLTGGINAVWSSTESRWEYREARNVSGNLTLKVESVVWGKYGITALSSSAVSHEVTMQWTDPPWYVALLPWVQGIGPSLFGIIGLITLIGILLRLGVLKFSTEEPFDSANSL